MNRFRFVKSLLAALTLAALVTACSASGSRPAGPAALSPSTPITAGTSVPEAPAGPSGLSPSTPITAGTGVPGAPAGPFLADGRQSGDLMVWLSSTPAQPVTGNAQLDTFLATSDGQPVTGAKVTYDTDMTNMSHGSYLVPAEPAEAGHYVGRVHFSMAGPWRVITIIERPGMPPVRLRFAFRVQSQ
jgi:hypothetical protein